MHHNLPMSAEITRYEDLVVGHELIMFGVRIFDHVGLGSNTTNILSVLRKKRELVIGIQSLRSIPDQQDP